MLPPEVLGAGESGIIGVGVKVGAGAGIKIAVGIIVIISVGMGIGVRVTIGAIAGVIARRRWIRVVG